MLLKNRFSKIVFFILILGLTPVWYYSIKTPFRLIDDYGHWIYIYTDFFEQFINWLTYFGKGRFRPVFEIGSGLYWTLFGPYAEIHHLMRIVLKVLTLPPIWLACRSIGQDQSNSAATGSISLKETAFPVFVLLFSIYFYFPNVPEARLAPQETASMFCMSWLIYFAVTIRHSRWRIDYLAATFLVLLYCWSKEINLFPVAVIAIYLSYKLFRILGPRAIILCIPQWLIIIHLAAKIYAASHAGYGYTPITFTLIIRNIFSLATNLFLYKNTLIWVFIFFLPTLGSFAYFINFIKKNNLKIFAKCYLDYLLLWTVLGANFIGYLFVWKPSLRYSYPLFISMVIVWLASVLLVINNSKLIFRKFLLYFLPVVALWFAGINYSSLAEQFFCQYTAGKSEEHLFEQINKEINQGKKVGIYINSEWDHRIALYFSIFRNQFYHEPLEQITVFYNENKDFQKVDLMVSRKGNGRMIAPIEPPKFRKTVKAITRVFRLGRKDEYFITDWGATPIDYFPWYLNEPDDPDNSRLK